MKPLFLAVLLMSMTAAEAKFFSRIDKHINTKTQEIIELSENDIDLEKGEATYFNYRLHKKAKVALSDLSIATSEEINGVKQGEYILATTQEGLTFCEVYYIFENGSGYVGCRTNKKMENLGMPRPAKANAVLSSVFHASVVAEVESINGFESGDIAVLESATERNEAGTVVRVEVVFANGEALVQKRGFNLLDTSQLVLKYSVEKVKLSQLRKIEE